MNQEQRTKDLLRMVAGLA